MRAIFNAGSALRIRPIAAGDWDELLVLENAAYAAHSLAEGRGALLSKQQSSPDTCFVLTAGRQLAAYLLSLPYPLLQYPALAHQETVAFQSGNLHLHDLVVAQRFRGQGLATRLLRQL